MSRFMLMLRADENASPGAPPQELFEAMGRIAQDWTSAGVLLDTAGLAPTAAGTRVRLSGGQITTESGPFTDDKEAVTAYALVEVDSAQDAIDRAVEFLALHKQHWPAWEGSSEVRQTFGPE
jgi:hypothetical protein